MEMLVSTWYTRPLSSEPITVISILSVITRPSFSSSTISSSMLEGRFSCFSCRSAGAGEARSVQRRKDASDDQQGCDWDVMWMHTHCL